jgi:anti-sigma regulatory factor (Ser/Thr protein kinase)
VRRDVILAADPSAAAQARRALNAAIPPPELAERFDDARLAASEIASNAVRHAGLAPDRDVVRMAIEADDEHVRVEVEQPTSASAVRVLPRDDARPGGLGLRLVDRLADAWGYEAGPPGRVWFEFKAHQNTA